MAKELPKLNMSDSLDELFSTEAERQGQDGEKVIFLNCNEIDSFQNHPYKVKDNEEMLDLVKSVQENGVVMPCIVRPKESGRYEMISGHRRKHAALLAGLNTLPVIVRNLDDVQATVLMVDSNAHRSVLLPSELAFAYKMKLDAMKRQGQRSDLTSSPLDNKLKGITSAQQIGQKSGDSQPQIYRYIRLTELLPDFLQMVDNSVEKPEDKSALIMAMRPAVELSYLTKENQRLVLEFVESSASTPSHAQAIKLREMQKNGTLTAQNVLRLLSEQKPNQKEHISLAVDKVSQYFPPNTSTKKMTEIIIKALDLYQRTTEKNRNEKVL